MNDGDKELREYTDANYNDTLTLIISDSYGTTEGDGVEVYYYRNGQCVLHGAVCYVKQDTDKVFDIDKALKAVGFFYNEQKEEYQTMNNSKVVSIEDKCIRVSHDMRMKAYNEYPLPTTQLEFDCLMYFIGCGAKPDILNSIKLKDL